MKGNAPKFSKTGSQVRVTKNSQPNLCRGRVEFAYSSKTSRTVTRKMLEAKTRVTRCAISSPVLRRRTHERARSLTPGGLSRPGRALSTRTVPTLASDPRNGFHLLRHNGLGKRGVRQRLAELLPVRHHPVQELRNGLPLSSVVDFAGDEQPGETRDRIGRFAWSIRDRDPEVIGYLLGSASRRR